MKYIKHPIPEEITDKGGASVQLVQKQTIPLDGAIDAAIEAHYAIGQKEFIRNGVIGTMKSMAAGVRRDGRPRSIEGFLTVYPVFKGPIDLEKGYDPEVNKVQIKARLLNELELDISGWSFEDVTPGKKAFKLNSVKAGSVMGVYQIGQIGNLNGSDLPSTDKGEELRVHWEVEGTDKSGDIPAAKLSSDVGRADIAADALAELDSEEYDGKTIVFTIRGNFSSGKISATLKYVAPPPPPTIERIVEADMPGAVENAIVLSTASAIHGANLADATVTFAYTKNDPDHTAASFAVDPSAVSETAYGLRIANSFWGSWVTELDTSVGGTFKVTTPGGTAEKFVTIG